MVQKLVDHRQILVDAREWSNSDGLGTRYLAIDGTLENFRKHVNKRFPRPVPPPNGGVPVQIAQTNG